MEPNGNESKNTGLVGRFLSWWVGLVSFCAFYVVIAFLVASGFLLTYTKSHIGINTDTSSMISPELEWRKTYLAFKNEFPQFFGEIVVVIDGATPDLADRARRLLARRLKMETSLFREVYVPGGGEFFEKNGLLYLNVDELEDLADNLAAVQPFLGKLIRDPSLVGLNSMLESAMKEAAKGGGIELAPVFDRLAGAYSAARGNRFYELSWQELMLGRKSKKTERRRFIIARPRLDFTELFQGEAAMKKIRSLAKEMSLDPYHGVRVRLTGSVALANEEMKSVSQGSTRSGILAFAAVMVILYMALRSLRLALASLVTLAVGIIGNGAFAALAVGNLNLISMAFAILYIGLGIDYAIHLSLRYRELVAGGSPHDEAIKKAAGDVGASIVLCTLTTAAGFYAFIPTAYSGVSELGLISGTGIFISLFANLTLLPALISLMPLRPEMIKRKVLRATFAERALGASVRYRTAVLSTLPVITLASLVLLAWAHFDSNPMNLRDERMESVATFNDLMKNSDTSPLTISVLKPDGPSARRSAAKLKRLETVKRAITIFDFIPKGQEEKLSIIGEMADIMGPELEYRAGMKPHTVEEKIRSIKDLRRGLAEFIPLAPEKEASSARAFFAEVDRSLDALGRLDRRGQKETITRLERGLVAALPERLRLLRASLEAGPVVFDDLPAELVARWVSKGGKYRVEAGPKEDISDMENLRRFVEEVRRVEPGATGLPVVIRESGKAVVGAFEKAFIYAFVFITVLLVVLMRSLLDTALVLFPILFAAVLTGAATVIFGIDFNFANIIALPLFLGIGVDNGIHIVHRYRTAPPERGSLFSTSTSRAVLYSALTTAVSFGVLAFSRHRGLASMGELLTIGIAVTVFSTLGVLPVMLSGGNKGGGQSPVE